MLYRCLRTANSFKPSDWSVVPVHGSLSGNLSGGWVNKFRPHAGVPPSLLPTLINSAALCHVRDLRFCHPAPAVTGARPRGVVCATAWALTVALVSCIFASEAF